MVSSEKLDKIYDQMDDLFKEEDFRGCDRVLESVDVRAISIDEMLGYLTATLPARGKLYRRGGFYCQVESEMRRRGEYEEGDLSGLE